MGRDRKQRDWNNSLEEKYIGKRKKAGIIIWMKKILRDREQKGRYSRKQRGWNR